MTTQTLPNVIVDIRPTGIESACSKGPFDKAKAALDADGYNIISLPVNAQLRMQQGRGHDVSRNGNYVREGLIYIQGRGNFLVRHSPILVSAEEATEAHRRGLEFYPTKEQIEEALEDSVRFPDSDIAIPTNRFGEEELTAWAFAEQANAYGEFLREGGIKAMPIYIVDKSYVNQQNKPFARQLWFALLDGRSGLGVDYWVLDYHVRVRGVRKMTSAEGAQKIEAYTPKQVAAILRDLELGELEEQIVSALRKQEH